jgi:hypothetical protein
MNNMARGTLWTHPRTERLKILWLDGVSAIKIAERLNELVGSKVWPDHIPVKAAELGLGPQKRKQEDLRHRRHQPPGAHPWRPEPKPKESMKGAHTTKLAYLGREQRGVVENVRRAINKQQFGEASKAAGFRERPPSPEAPVPLDIAWESVFGKAGKCQFPIGDLKSDRATFKLCGHPSVSGPRGPYCPYHRILESDGKKPDDWLPKVG